MEAHQLQVKRTAHYYIQGQIGAHIRHLIIATHGYGQLARKFILNFRAIQRDDILVVAPEGLSKFYWDGFGGPPVASWMTREHRLDEIADFSAYLQQLLNHLLVQLPTDVEVTLFGFSQGCATQMRWIHALQPPFDRLICWAGTIPEDIDYQPIHDYLATKELILACGNADQFLTPERLRMLKGMIQEKGLAFSLTEFEGRHEIPEKALIQCWNHVLK